MATTEKKQTTTAAKKTAKKKPKPKTDESAKEITVPALQQTQEGDETLIAGDKKDEIRGSEKYYEAIGRRKTSIARVRVYTKKSTDAQPSETKGIIEVNGKLYSSYFGDINLQNVVDSPLKKLKSLNRFKATIKVSGGGARGQAEAARLGLARGLVLFDQNFSKKLRKSGYLTRDSREKERRKYGLKKARKAPQWSKR